MHDTVKKIICASLGMIMTGVAWASSCYFSRARVNTDKYPVFGVDVSNYQGDIDWQKLEEQEADTPMNPSAEIWNVPLKRA